MNLTKNQLDSVVSFFRRAHEKKNKPFSLSPEKRRELTIEAKRICRIANHIPLDVRKELYCDKFNVKRVFRALESIEKSKHPVPSFDATEIRQQILLASIDCNSFAELRKKFGI